MYAATASGIEPAFHTQEGAHGSLMSVSGCDAGCSASPLLEPASENALENLEALEDNQRSKHHGKLVDDDEDVMDQSFTSNAEDSKVELGDTRIAMDRSFTSTAEEPHGETTMIDHSFASIVLTRLPVGHTHNDIGFDAIFGDARVHLAISRCKFCF